MYVNTACVCVCVCVCTGAVFGPDGRPGQPSAPRGFLGGSAHGLVTRSCHPGAAVPSGLRLHRPARAAPYSRQPAAEDRRGPGTVTELGLWFKSVLNIVCVYRVE